MPLPLFAFAFAACASKQMLVLGVGLGRAGLGWSGLGRAEQPALCVLGANNRHATPCGVITFCLIFSFWTIDHDVVAIHIYHIILFDDAGYIQHTHGRMNMHALI